MRAFFRSLDSEELPSAPRAFGQAPVRDVPLWQLSDYSMQRLRAGLPGGFVVPSFPKSDLWLEDLTVYRDSEAMMGVMTIDGFGLVRVTEAELGQLREAGFPDRDESAL